MMRGIEQKTTLEQKLEKLRLICEKAPDNSIGLLALAETAFRRGLRLEALEAYQKVLKDESVAEAHLCMAQMYRHHGLFQEAITELRTLFEIEPGYPEAHVFARELASETTLPPDIEEVLVEGCGNDELSLARVRLSIARSLVLREGQELVAIQDANSGDPTFGYYIGETRKRLTYCEEVLSRLNMLEEARRTYLADQDRQRQIERERQLELVELGRQRAAAAQAEAQAAEVQAQTTVASDMGLDMTVDMGVYESHEESLEVDGYSSEAEVSYELDELAGLEVSQPLDPGQDLSEAPEVQAGLIEAQIERVFTPSALDMGGYEPEPVHQVDHPESTVAPLQLLVDMMPAPELYIRPEEPVSARGPALWDDPPRVLSHLTEAAEPLLDAYAHHEDMTLDLTPTLVGDLPDPEPEDPVSAVALVLDPEPEPVAVGELWDDGPLPLPDEQAVACIDPIPEEIQEAAPESVEGLAESVDSGQNFAQLYQPLLASLDGLIQTLAKTRSVSSVFLLNRDGYPICEQVKDPITRERLSEFILETVSFLEAFSDSPQYWVLECAGGIVVIQSVDSFHFLVTIGQTGANFGALRYTMDRVRPNFEQVLQAVTPS
ncbi:tetratricopeptide repeat protein [bacterium]|nr:tetratricopeptide repeat protein [bacterium]